MPEVEGAGVALHYEERGSGPALLVIHAMASGAGAWAPAIDGLARSGVRAIVYDRRGYGASGAPEPYLATTVQEQSQDAAALLTALDAHPALLVGEGFGALVALELLVRRPELAYAAVLAEPPLHAYVPEATAVLAAERLALEQALRDGGPAAAVRAWSAGHAAGESTGGHAGFFADYGGQASWSPSRRELRGVTQPVVVVTRSASLPHTAAAADAAAALLPASRRATDGDVALAVRALLASSGAAARSSVDRYHNRPPQP